MAITYIGAGTAASSDTIVAVLNVPYPASVTANDLIVLAVANSTANVPALPSGFVSAVSGTSGGNTPRFLIATRVAAGSESGSISVDAGGSTGRWLGRMLLFRGVDPTTPIDVTGTTFGTATSGSACNLPTLTTTTTGAALVAYGAGLSATATWTPPTVPATFTEVWDLALAGTLCNGLEYLIWAGSGATGAVNLASSISMPRRCAGLIALRPAAGAPPPKTGTATGTYAFDRTTATGARTPKASATTGTYLWARTTATGTRTPKATATGAYAWNRTTVTGSKPTKGTAAGAMAWHGIATGLAPTIGVKAGTATGAYLWARTTATGYVLRTGTTTTGAYAYAGTATGQTTVLIGYVVDFDGHLTHAWHGGTRHPIRTFTAPTYATQILADAPLAYYRMADTAGTTLTDSSGNARHGTIPASPQQPLLNQPSLLPRDGNPSMDFDGASGTSGDYCSIADAAWMDVTTAVTLEWWSRPDNVTTLQAPLDRDSTTAAQKAWQVRQEATGLVAFLFWNPSGTIRGGYWGNTVLTVGNIYHHAVTYDGATVRWYLNGAADGTHTITDSIRAVATPIRIGRNSSVTNGSAYYNGRIDEVAIYGTVLSATRIAAHYAAATT